MATSQRTIQHVSAETGLSADTLRYYERVGVLPGIARSGGGKRLFSDNDLGWIKLVQCLRATGMSIEQLHAYAELMQQGDSTAPERLRMLQDHRQRIVADIAELQTALELVDRKIDGYSDLLATGLRGDPPDHKPVPRKVRVRAGN
jgi:DNA-binding transcriptional MerR regulator